MMQGRSSLIKCLSSWPDVLKPHAGHDIFIESLFKPSYFDRSKEPNRHMVSGCDSVSKVNLDTLNSNASTSPDF